MTESQGIEILKIYKQYHQVVKHMVIELETDDGEFPVEVLNEIRAILNHLAKCYLLDEEKPEGYQSLLDIQIHDAKSHLKRAIFDCYKYSCISVEDYYSDFCKRMKHVDLGVIDNGEFSVTLSKKYSSARCSLKTAKNDEQDSMSASSFDTIFDLYKNAYEAYDDVRKYIDESLEKIERARHKQAISWWVSIGFGIVGVISLIVSLLK